MACCCREEVVDPDALSEETGVYVERLKEVGEERSIRPVKIAAQNVFTPVYLNVYNLVEAKKNKRYAWFGFGLFHSGLEIFGIEWSFGEAVDKDQESGVFCVSPFNALPSFYQRVYLGETILSPEQVDTILHRMENEWKTRYYHVLHCNCNHFTKAFAKALSTCTPLIVPNWLNRAASWGDCIIAQSFATWVVRKYDKDTIPVAPPPPFEGKVRGLPQSVVPPRWWQHPAIGRSRQFTMVVESKKPREPEPSLPAVVNGVPRPTLPAPGFSVRAGANRTPPPSHIDPMLIDAHNRLGQPGALETPEAAGRREKFLRESCVNLHSIDFDQERVQLFCGQGRVAVPPPPQPPALSNEMLPLPKPESASGADVEEKNMEEKEESPLHKANTEVPFEDEPSKVASSPLHAPRSPGNTPPTFDEIATSPLPQVPLAVRSEDTAAVRGQFSLCDSRSCDTSPQFSVKHVALVEEVTPVSRQLLPSGGSSAVKYKKLSDSDSSDVEGGNRKEKEKGNSKEDKVQDGDFACGLQASTTAPRPRSAPAAPPRVEDEGKAVKKNGLHNHSIARRRLSFKKEQNEVEKVEKENVVVPSAITKQKDEEKGKVKDAFLEVASKTTNVEAVEENDQVVCEQDIAEFSDPE